MQQKLLVEMKAKHDNLDTLRNLIFEVGGKFKRRIKQRDIYYLIGEERLKLRVSDDECKLIYYRRPLEKNVKRSLVIISRVIDREAMRSILSIVIGEKIIVEKIREIYTYDDIKIHLDRVSSLGNFIEFEKETREEAIEKDTLKLKRLMDILGIKESDLIEGSYSDLLIERNYK